MEQMERTVQMALTEHKVLKAQQVLMELMEQTEHKVLKDQQEPMVQMERKVQQD